MAETLFPAGAQLLQGAANTASNIGQQRVERERIRTQAASQALSEIGDNVREISNQRAQMALKQMEMEGNQVEITPQIALGLAKNTGDKEWMMSVGQKMRADVLLGIYTHGINLVAAKRSHKITQVYDKEGKVRHSVVYTDEAGNLQQLILDAGMTPEKLHPSRSREGAQLKVDQLTFQQRKEWVRDYEKRRTEYSDPIRAKMVQGQNPEKYKEDQQYLEDYRDTYDEILKSFVKGQGNKPGSPRLTPGSDSGGEPEAPFDAEAFIQDALGQ